MRSVFSPSLSFDIDMMSRAEALPHMQRLLSQSRRDDEVQAGTVRQVPKRVAEDVSELFVHSQYPVLKADQHDRLRCLLKQFVQMGALLFLGIPSRRAEP